MNFWRLIFLASQVQYLTWSQWQTYLWSFVIGLRLDAVVASYLILPLGFLFLFKTLRLIPRFYGKISSVYFFIAAFTISLFSIVDVFTFREFNTHVNFLTVSSYVTQEDSMSFIFKEYPIIWAILILIILTTLPAQVKVQ